MQYSTLLLLWGNLKNPSQPVFVFSLSGNCVDNSSCPWSRVLSKQATHPNMRTYYFCTDTAKEMESWMKVMTDAALVQSEPVKRFVRALTIKSCLLSGCVIFELRAHGGGVWKSHLRTVLQTSTNSCASRGSFLDSDFCLYWKRVLLNSLLSSSATLQHPLLTSLVSGFVEEATMFFHVM